MNSRRGAGGSKLLRLGSLMVLLFFVGNFVLDSTSSFTQGDDNAWEKDLFKTLFSQWKKTMSDKALEIIKSKVAGMISEHAEGKASKKREQICKNVKKKGEIPSAERGHSPILQFGYPRFDEISKMTFLRPGVSLSHMYGFKQPVKFGATDFIASGTLASLVDFFDCFSEYSVIPSLLGSDGKWEKSSKGFYMQLQDAVPIDTAHGSVKAILFRASIDRILKSIEPGTIISPELLQILPEDLDGLARAIENHQQEFFDLLQWMPSNNKEKALKLWNQMRAAESLEERLIIFSNFVTRASPKKHLEWDGLKYIDFSSPQILTLTSYPAPNHRNRATFWVDCSQCTMEDVAKALSRLIE